MAKKQAEEDPLRSVKKKKRTEQAANQIEANHRARESDSRYRFLYEVSPFPLVEMDCSALKAYLDELVAKGVQDLRAYFSRHSEALSACAAKIEMLDVNNATVDLFKADSRNAVLEKSLELFSPESYSTFCDGIIAYAEGKDSFDCEIEAQTFAGEHRLLYLRWSVIPSDGAGRTRMLGSLIDITERKEMFDELTIFKTATDMAKSGNVITDAGGTLTYVNQAFAEMHGFEVEDLVGRDFRMLHTAEQMEQIRQWTEKLQGEETVKNIEIWHQKKDGTAFPTLMNAVFVKDADGRVLCTYASAIDISDLKEAENSLQKREKELEANNVRLEEMNAALKVLLRSRETDKNELEEKVVKNVKELSLPMVAKLKVSGLNARQQAYVDILESSLHEIVSPFVRSLSNHYPGLTPTELTIANLIKEGKDSKDIAEMLNLSKRSVDTYRNRIRKKFGLTNQKVNLRIHLLRLR